MASMPPSPTRCVERHAATVPWHKYRDVLPGLLLLLLRQHYIAFS